MQTQELLRLIETVDHTDEAKLDELDARVHEYLGFFWHGDGKSTEWKEWAGHWANYEGNKRGKGLCECSTQMDFSEDPKTYTRSRDALKAIRLDGWVCFASLIINCKRYIGYGFKRKKKIRTPDLPTEELAELHAVIQSMAFESSIIKQTA